MRILLVWIAGLCVLLTLALAALPVHTAEVQPSPVLAAMAQELEWTMVALKEQEQPPYYLSYEITDEHAARVSASYGALASRRDYRERLLDIDLRVGSYALDSSHPIRGDQLGMVFRSGFERLEMPIEDDPAAIRSLLWYHTDRRYKQALEQFTKVTTNVKVKIEEEDQSADFSKEEPQVWLGELKQLEVDLDAWESRLRRYTEPFAAHGDLYEANGSFSATREDRWFVNSDGTKLQTSRMVYRLVLSAVTKADDGMELPRYETYFAYSVDGLPGDEEVLKTVHQMIEDLEALRAAPIVDPYTGPAILSGRAAGVFFHEIFGHRMEAHRMRNEEDAQTFKKMMGEEVLPPAFSVTFDPTKRTLDGTDLAGYYRFDNQGVKARPVRVVDHGKLESFLMSRRPIEGFPQSNGHGRKHAGFAPVSRQSSLVVSVDDPVSYDELKKMLVEKIKEEDKPFGLVFEDIQGGFTFTGRTIPNAFNVLPVMVYRIFPDGRQELVRGVDLIGTPLTAFSKLIAGTKETAVFNGYCGAESGAVPVSAASPALLVGQIEVQKKGKSQNRPPLLPAPIDLPREDGS